MYGEILNRYRELGGPNDSGLGFPKNDESETGDTAGRFNDFSAPEAASTYWTPQWGAAVINGLVLDAWRQSGGITGPFRLPQHRHLDRRRHPDTQVRRCRSYRDPVVQAGGLISVRS